MPANNLFSSTVGKVLSRYKSEGKPFLVAVSGGPDSMALLHCCVSMGYACVVAHVNYGLRGRESDADELLVKQFCDDHGLVFEVLRVRDEDWKNHLGSTQEAARSIRYTWFKALKEKYAANYVLTGHHANDQTETMLFQFVRGGSGRSVYGMPEHSNGVLRPMLSITKSVVKDYLQTNDIPWRNDSTNDSTDYKRNQVRHEIMPLVESLNPFIHETIQQRADWMHQEQAMVDWAAKSFLDHHLVRTNGAEVISITDLLATCFQDVLLWKWLGGHGFSSQQVIQISEHIQRAPISESAWFYSSHRRICIQNDHIACVDLAETIMEVIEPIPWFGCGLRIDYCSPTEVEFTDDSKRQYLDADAISGPLIVRTWKEGDRFRPLGLGGNQKVSDFLTHTKMAAWQKDQVLVLCSGEEVAAVLQLRISENFKKTDTTSKCLRIQFS